MAKYCWEWFGCKNSDCPVYQTKEYKCWLISGTLCRHEIQGNFLEKIEMCLPCEIFKANMEVTALEETLALVAKQVQELRDRVEMRDQELRDINLELAIGSAEVYEALKEISSGNPHVRIPETSDLEIISKLKSMVNLTAVNLAEIIDLSHEFAIGLAEHFDVLHRVSKGDLTARVLGTSPVELLEFLKKMTNETIESVDRSINERIKAEEALRESEEKYRLIVNQIPEVVFKGYADWSVDFFDRKIEEITGFKKEDFDSRRLKWNDLIISEDIDCLKNAFVEALKSTKSYIKEYRIRTKTGKPRWVQIRGQIFCDIQGKIEYISGVLFDITEIKQAEKVLKESEEKYRLLMDNASDAIVLADIDGKVLEVNQKAEKLLGYGKEELLGLDFGQLFSSEELERATTCFREIVQLGFGYLNDSRLLARNGDQVPVDLTASLVEYSGKTLMQSFFRDISKRKKTEEALHQKEHELGLVVNNIPAVVFKGYPDGSVNLFDDKIELMTGYPKTDFDSRHLKWSDLILKECMEEARKVFIRALRSHRSYVREYRIKTNSEKVLWIQERSHIVCDRHDRIEYVSGIFFDITERKKLEEERDRLFNLSLDMLCVAGFDGFFKQLNPAWSKTLGWPETELLRRPYLSFVHPEDRLATTAAGEQLKAGQPVIQFENRYQCLDGSYRWISWNSFPLLEEKLIFAVARDVTEKRQLEDQFLQAQKMEAVGRLAGGLAHDFNNLLTAILGYGEIMMLDLRKEDPFHLYVEEITKAVNRGASLINQLLAFSRKQILRPRVINLNEVVMDMDRMLRRLIGEDIELVTSICQEPGIVKADPSQIEQILMNLAVNARDAMPHGGKLTVETANVYLDQDYSWGHLGVTPGPHVMLSVSDSGTGMEAATLPHIFEPFFTTKELGRGTGLGLATVYGIVKHCGGNIWVYSEPDKGTTFKVYLPRVGERAEALKPKLAAPTPPRGNETIMMVEDDASLRDLICKGLRRYGFTVLEAAHGSEAMMLCEKEKGPIHLLLTDVVMPQISGSALAERLKLLHPEMKVLYMSGYTENAIVHHGVLDFDVNFIGKPFRIVALAQKVREVLDTSMDQ
jgi:PAS domain S-box-containing protein